MTNERLLDACLSADSALPCRAKWRSRILHRMECNYSAIGELRKRMKILELAIQVWKEGDAYRHETINAIAEDLRQRPAGDRREAGGRPA